MGSNVKKAFGADAMSDLLWLDPEKLVIVTDPKHPLYDARHKLPVDEKLVKSFLLHGCKKPILVRKNGETKGGEPIVEVVDGRQRVKACREANRRAGRKPGDPDYIRVTATTTRTDGASAFALTCLLNEGHHKDDPITLARKMQRLLDMGSDLEYVAVSFQRSEADVKKHLRLLDLGEDAQAAVSRKELSVSAALNLTKLPRAEQTEALTSLREASEETGEKKTAAVVEKAVAATGRTKASPKRARNRKEIAAWRERLREEKFEGDLFDLVDAVLLWAEGGDLPGYLLDKLPKGARPEKE
jgi:ParB family chromosome partitioning protein